MAKIDVSKVINNVQKLYAKDKKVSSIITTADHVKSDYTDNDVSPIPENHPLRLLLGLPGIPFNKIVEVSGRKDCGKSTWGNELIVEAQKKEIQTVAWDSEDKLDSARLTLMGGISEDVLMVKTNEILKGGELLRKYVNEIKQQDINAKILLVWDSIGGSNSRSHAERELDSETHAQPGADAKEIVSVFKMIVALFNKYPDSIAMYVSNQVYAKIGFMQHGDATSGGPKKDHYFSFSVSLKNIKVLTKTIDKVVHKYGIISRATVTKNHLSQGKTSIHQLDFQVTSEGSKLLSGAKESNEVVENESEHKE